MYHLQKHLITVGGNKVNRCGRIWRHPLESYQLIQGRLPDPIVTPHGALNVISLHRAQGTVSIWNRLSMLMDSYYKDKAVVIRSSSWASCQIREIAGAHAPGMPGTFSPSPQVSDPDMHHGTCVTHVPWCMPGSLTTGFLWNRRRGKTFPAFPAHAQPAILRIW